MKQKKEFKASLMSILLFFIVLSILFNYVYVIGTKRNIEKAYTTLKLKYNELYAQINAPIEEENNKKQEYQKRDELNKKKGNIDIDSDLVQSLHKKVLNSESLTDDGETSFYKENKTTINSFNNEELLMATIDNLPIKENVDVNNFDKNILKKLNFCPVSDDIEDYEEYIRNLKIYTEDEIKETAQSIFGKDLKFKYQDFIGSGHTHEFIGNILYEYDFNGGGYGPRNHGFSKLLYAEETENEMYLYDKYIFIRDFAYEFEYDTENSGKYTEYVSAFYTSSDAEKPIAINGIDLSINILDMDNDKALNLINKLYDKLHTYKHTFSKDETGNYYWVSTEKLENSEK